MDLKERVQNLRQNFITGGTLDVNFRLDQLKKLKHAILSHESEIMAALKKDLNKSDFEAYITEIFVLIQEINLAVKHLKKWVKPERVRTSIFNFPGKSRIYKEPYGVVLIISPWNYPFQLALSPLIGAISAGNCAILKPSELSPNVSEVVQKVVESSLDRNYFEVICGDVNVSTRLLEEQFDYLFFTGSVNVGRKVMAAASKHLTPVTLELGGKSPCIVDPGTDLAVTARRIAWGKWVNSGQTCIAPDYLFVHKSEQADLIGHLQKSITSLYGLSPLQSQDYGKIISKGHFDRLCAYLKDGEVIHGGNFSQEQQMIEPTLLTNVSWDSAVMQEEIFGPILPVFAYENLEDALEKIRERPKPLALYLFSNNRKTQEKVLQSVSFGGGCINDTILHVGEPGLPFGGVGESGMGAYHGKHSFDTFTHRKSVLKKSFWPDPALRYAPYGNKLSLLKKLFG